MECRIAICAMENGFDGEHFYGIYPYLTKVEFLDIIED